MKKKLARAALFLTALSGIPGAMSIVFSSIASKKRNPLLLTTSSLFFVMVFAWISVAFTNGFPKEFQLKPVICVIYLGIFATAICLFLQTYGLKYAPPTVGGMIMSLEAVFGVTFAILLYKEEITIRMYVGFVVIFLAIVLSQVPTKEETLIQNEVAVL